MFFSDGAKRLEIFFNFSVETKFFSIYSKNCSHKVTLVNLHITVFIVANNAQITYLSLLNYRLWVTMKYIVIKGFRQCFFVSGTARRTCTRCFLLHRLLQIVDGAMKRANLNRNDDANIFVRKLTSKHLILIFRCWVTKWSFPQTLVLELELRQQFY